jgi:anion-transporting  ArsA/GET3 family ATPase
MRDVLLTGKVYEAVRRKRDGTQLYDAVVMDAPPTGRITQFLNVNAEVAGLTRGGPIRHQADSIMSVLRSPQTVVHVVTLLEDMPVQETCDAVAELTEAKLPVGAVVVNAVREPWLRPRALQAAAKGRLDADELRAGLHAAGLREDDQVVDGLLLEAREHAQRVALEKSQRKLLTDLDRPTYDLPFLPGGVDRGALYELADALREQGAA